MMKDLFLSFMFLLAVFLCNGENHIYKNKRFKSQNMEPVDLSEWGIVTEEEHPLVVELNEDNFEKIVMKSNDAWVVILYAGFLPLKWKEHSKRVKGSLFYGKINLLNQRSLANKLFADLDEEELMKGIPLLFPFGSKTKMSSYKYWPKRASNISEIERIAVSTFPDRFEKLNFEDDKMEDFSDWIVSSFYESNPSRFPVVCVVDADDTQIPLSIMAISNYLDSHFSFALLTSNRFDFLRKHMKSVPVPKSYPNIFVMLGKEPSSEAMNKGSFGMTFSILPFLDNKYGDCDNFFSLLKFLFTTNDDYREFLPGRNLAEAKSITHMRAVVKSLNKRLSKIQQNILNVKTEL